MLFYYRMQFKTKKYNNRISLPKRVIREKARKQSVQKIQIVYNTKSELNVILNIKPLLIAVNV